MKSRRKTLKKQAIKDSFWGIISKFIGRGGGFIFGILLARLLMPERFGLYNIGLAVASIFLVFAELGFNTANLRFVPKFLIKNDKLKASAYFRYILKLKFLFAIITTILFIILAYPLANLVFRKPLFSIFVFFAIYTLLMSLQTFFESSFYTIKKVNYLGIKEIILQTTRISLFILFFFLVPKVYSILGAIWAIIFGLLFSIFFLLFYLQKHARFLFKNHQPLEHQDKKYLLRFLFYLGAMGFSAAFFVHIDSIMLGVLLPGSEFVGFYKAAFTLVFSLSSLFLLGSITIPLFSQASKSELNLFFNKFFRYGVIISIPLVAGFMIFSSYILRTVYGYSYLSATLPLIFLAPLVFEIIIAKLPTTILIAKEKLKFLMIFTIIVSIINIILNYTLILTLSGISNVWGMVGASIATVTSRYILLIGIFIYIKKKFNISPNFLIIIKSLVATIIMSGVLLLITLRWIPDMNLVIGLLSLLLGVIIYRIVMFLVKGITFEDFKNIKYIFR